ncbi:glycosyltransferase family 2 protein [Pseudonocardia kunmingensis]|uniref:glycosyltransferase family 2 protein n=1 Tax=Pseudonocardia kunmingensis TaxID=630975 RepID=UPI0014792175|nr:glycosyltransferase family 2 protein [Pseudonocardia kunmingensis]
MVIPTYQAGCLIGRCLDSVERHLPDVEIIVVDNASTDDTVPRVEQHGVRLIRNGSNLGFGTACNRGVDAATAEHIVLLNQDVVLESSLADAQRILDSVTWVGAVGGTMTDSAGQTRPNAYRYPRLDNVVWRRRSHDRRAMHALTNGEPLISVDYFEFSLAVLRRADYLRMGGFDERYFMYGEERDLMYRLARAGLRAVLSPLVRYVHDGGYSDARRQLVIDGQLRFVADHGNRRQRIVYPRLLALKSAVRTRQVHRTVSADRSVS